MKKRYVLKNKFRFSCFITLLILLTIIAVLSNIAYCSKQQSYKVVVVKQGETLWNIAKYYKKNMDIRESIYEIKKVNNLTNSEIFVGNELKIPLE